MYKKFFSVVGLIGVGIAGRLLPHAPNATPITAITLAAHKHVGRVWAFVVPMAAMVLSDAFIGFYDWKILASVYGSFLLISVLSRLVMQKSSNPLTVALLAVGASLIFFMVTNFTVWIFSPWYEKSIGGLLYCYTLGVPFLRNMLIGDIAYTVVLFGLLTVPLRTTYVRGAIYDTNKTRASPMTNA